MLTAHLHEDWPMLGDVCDGQPYKATIDGGGDGSVMVKELEIWSVTVDGNSQQRSAILSYSWRFESEG